MFRANQLFAGPHEAIGRNRAKYDSVFGLFMVCHQTITMCTPCVALDEQRTPCVALDEQRTTLPNEFLELYLGPGVEIAVLGFHLDDLKTMVRCGVDVKRWADKLNVLHKMWICLNTAGENRIPAFKDVLLFLLDEVGVEINNQFRDVDYNKLITSWKHDCRKFISILVKYGLDLRSLRNSSDALYRNPFGVQIKPNRDMFSIKSALVHTKDALRNTHQDIIFVFDFSDILEFSPRYINLLTCGYEIPFDNFIKRLIKYTRTREYIAGLRAEFYVEHTFAFDALIQA